VVCIAVEKLDIVIREHDTAMEVWPWAGKNGENSVKTSN